MSDCIWRCGDQTPDHKHYAVLVRHHGKLLGRLAPGGTTTNRNIYACVLSAAKADEIAADINSGNNNLIDGLTAKVIPFSKK